MRLLIEIQTDDQGRAIRAKIVSGGLPKPRKKRVLVTRREPTDSAAMELLRTFLAFHGVVKAAALLKISRRAVYQWVARASVPAKHLAEIDRINAE